MRIRVALVSIALFSAGTLASAQTYVDMKFDSMDHNFITQFTALSPVTATQLGDHRFDDELDDVSALGRKRALEFYRRQHILVLRFPREQLTREHQVDAELLRHHIESSMWRIQELEEWAWNPLVYTDLAGGALYGLMARDFAPLGERLGHVAGRLEKLPQFFDQVRGSLDPKRVPPVHAETAVKQNRGLNSILDEMIVPHVGTLPPAERTRLEQAIQTARGAIQKHQQWLEQELVPAAAGDFRLGAERFDRKLAFTLHTPLTRQQIHARAQREFDRVRNEMYNVARVIHAKEHPGAEFPSLPDDAHKQAIIRGALEVAYRQRPARDEIVGTARQLLAETTEFVRTHDLVTVPADPIDIIVMPEFQRGVAVAYCDSPGPLDTGQKTFYAVAPLPADWTEEQVTSFLREYNLLSLRDLTVHEAMPGHFLQQSHANRYSSPLRAVLASGPFVEGWAVYAERMMVDAGYRDGDPLMRLIQLKWYLRAVTNALLDQAVHVDGMTREKAMKLMTEGAFQEEREAAGKWVRAQLTSTQLSTYFVGYQEHADLRAEVEKARGADFKPKDYHDRVLSFGSPPVQFVRALVLDRPIPATTGWHDPIPDLPPDPRIGPSAAAPAGR